MDYKKHELKKGINIHIINADKFKTNLLSVFLTTPIIKENVTKSALLPMVLRRGSKNMPNQEEISKHLEEMYGASFDCGVDKIGDDQVLKFYIEAVNNDFLPVQEDIFSKTIDSILNIVFNPLIENNAFKKEYIETEKDNLKQIIEGKIDSKAAYAQDRCIEEMYKDKPYGIYKYGYTDYLEEITPENLHGYYKQLISECKIDIFISGKLNDNTVLDLLNKNDNIIKLNSRQAKYIINNGNNLDKKEEPSIVEEHMDINQGKLVMGLNIDDNSEKGKYIGLVYNGILGGLPTSKLFQNVREKASLAYTSGSSYIRQKNNILIKCGIEIENYDKAVEIIKQQIEDMKQGKFDDEDIKNAKTSIVASIKFIPDEQDTLLTYYFGQELSEYKMKYEEYEDRINEVTKDDITDYAKKVSIHTIYFLRN